MPNIDNLSIQIEAESTKAAERVNALASALERLQNSVKENGLSSAVKSISNIGKTATSEKKSVSRPEPVSAVTNTVEVESATQEVEILSEKTKVLQSALNNLSVPDAISKLDIEIKRTTASYNDLKKSLAEKSTLDNTDLQKLTALRTELEALKSKRAKLQVNSSDVDEAAKKVGFLSKLLKSIQRIAFYRVIRAGMKIVSEAFSTGIKDLYQYSKALKGEFADKMDMLATSALYLKNSLGAMVSPLINSLAPVVDILVDKFVDLLNSINQVFAALSGKTTYTKAIKQTQEYAEAANGAAKAVKSFQLGIDELNVIEPTIGGAGTAGQDFSTMFEEAEIDSKISDIAKKFEKIIPTVKKIGQAIAAWALAKTLSDDLKKFGILGKTLSTVVTIAVEGAINWGTIADYTTTGNPLDLVINAASTAFGTYLLYKKWGEKGILLGIGVAVVANLASLMWQGAQGNIEADDPKPYIVAAVTSALGGIGGAIGLSKLGFFASEGLVASFAISASLAIAALNFSEIASGNWTVGGVESTIASILSTAAASVGGAVIGTALFPGAGTLIGAIGGLLVGVTLNIVAISMGKQVQYEQSDFHKEMEELREKAAESMEVSKQIKVNIETRYTEFSKISSKYTEYMNILDKIFELDAIPEKSAKELGLMSEYINIINGLGIDNLSITLDNQTGKIREEKAALQEVIQTLQEKAKKEALYELTVQAYKEQANAAIELAKQQSNLKKIEDEIAQMMEEYEVAYKNAKEVTLTYAGGTIKTSQALFDLGRKLTDAKETQEALTDSIQEAQSALDKANEEIKFYDDALSGIGTTVKSVVPELDKGFSEMEKSAKNTASSISNSLSSAFETIKRKIKEIPNQLDISASANIKYMATTAVEKYASGGFPTTGQMFIAREAGPELVGNISGKTAVANNSQIETGIEEAAYRGFMRAMEESKGGQSQQPIVVESKLYLDGKQVTSSVEKTQRERGATIMEGGVMQ